MINKIIQKTSNPNKFKVNLHMIKLPVNSDKKTSVTVMCDQVLAKHTGCEPIGKSQK